LRWVWGCWGWRPFLGVAQGQFVDLDGAAARILIDDEDEATAREACPVRSAR
jgi:cbb3-type cytochrome oxidase maturation protein